MWASSIFSEYAETGTDNTPSQGVHWADLPKYAPGGFVRNQSPLGAWRRFHSLATGVFLPTPYQTVRHNTLATLSETTRKHTHILYTILYNFFRTK